MSPFTVFACHHVHRFSSLLSLSSICIVMFVVHWHRRVCHPSVSSCLLVSCVLSLLHGILAMVVLHGGCHRVVLVVVVSWCWSVVIVSWLWLWSPLLVATLSRVTMWHLVLWLSGSYHFYDKIQSSACTTLSTLPRVEMINTALGKCYEKHFIKFHCCLAFNFIAYPALFHSCPALNFIACPALFHWNFILAWPYFIGISFLPRL